MQILRHFKEEGSFMKDKNISIRTRRMQRGGAFVTAIMLAMAPALTAHGEEKAPSEAQPAVTRTDAVPTKATLAEQQYLRVELTRTDKLGDKVFVDDVLTFRVRYTNLSAQKLTAFPAETNLSNVRVGDAKNCRWSDLAAGDTKECNFAQHRVTTEDLNQGSFSAYTVWKATKDREGTQVLQGDIRVEAPSVKVVSGERPVAPDPATIPTDRKEGEPVVLGTHGSAKFDCHRIPAITTAPNGWLLAAWDGRPGSCNDSPQANSIIQRISKDGGKSWEPIKVIAAGQPTGSIHGYSDPSYVVDQETKTIHMFFVKSFDNGFGASQPGVEESNRKALHAATMSSTDNGVTWTTPRVITKDITKDLGIASRFAASGQGIQLKYGPHKGRLMQQYTVRKNGRNQAVSVFSDDHGVTWQSGEPFGIDMDENKVVELSDGSVMLNSRSSDNFTKARKIGISHDGGHTYTDFHVDQTLIDPNNNGAIIRAYPDAPMGSAQAKILLFTNAASKTAREKGTVRISYDDGKTWSQSKQFEPNKIDYSTITPLSTPGTYGLLFEARDGGAGGQGYQIKYTQISLDWIGGLPVLAEAKPAVLHRGAAQITVKVTNLGAAVQGAQILPTLPDGWLLPNPVSVNLAAGQSKDVVVPVTVSNSANPGKIQIPFVVKSGARESKFSADVEVRLYTGEKGIDSVPVKLVKDLPAETVKENGALTNILDGKLDTIWHSPWSQTMKFPLDIDFTIDKSPSEVRSVQFINRQDSSNGRIAKYELYVGTSDKDLILVHSGEAGDNGNPVDIPVDIAGALAKQSAASNSATPSKPMTMRLGAGAGKSFGSARVMRVMELPTLTPDALNSKQTYVRLRIISTYGPKPTTLASLSVLKAFADVYGTDQRLETADLASTALAATATAVPPTPVLQMDSKAPVKMGTAPQGSTLAHTGSDLIAPVSYVVLFLCVGVATIFVSKWKGKQR
ncbi:hypothetical protein JOD55_001001 [Arcanobacterium pluranimalium]|uniref:exo-alpha-sialidase n=1 Tax=Arcanobacterium pluranimalium TaxID=108028 RepID=UPI00195D92CF|nr:exo-alpha-sialidase [Arcanobacterium pluranimalium]MBM7825174.1 hypothetical protein [Arcanobacterium pluranimalium]